MIMTFMIFLKWCILETSHKLKTTILTCIRIFMYLKMCIYFYKLFTLFLKNIQFLKKVLLFYSRVIYNWASFNFWPFDLARRFTLGAVFFRAGFCSLLAA